MEKAISGKKVYISGKITGMEAEAWDLFEKAEAHLSELEVSESINPMKLDHNHDKKWESYMKVCIKALCDCDVIYVMSNYKESKGALMEIDVAVQLGLDIVYSKLI